MNECVCSTKGGQPGTSVLNIWILKLRPTRHRQLCHWSARVEQGVKSWPFESTLIVFEWNGGRQWAITVCCLFVNRGIKITKPLGPATEIWAVGNLNLMAASAFWREREVFDSLVNELTNSKQPNRMKNGIKLKRERRRSVASGKKSNEIKARTPH